MIARESRAFSNGEGLVQELLKIEADASAIYWRMRYGFDLSFKVTRRKSQMFKPNHSCSNSRSFGRRPNFTLNAHGNEAKNALGGFMAEAPKSRKPQYGTSNSSSKKAPLGVIAESVPKRTLKRRPLAFA
jgi:hypothetical protein